MKRTLFIFFAILSLIGIIAISGCKKKETYTVTFDANGGTGEMADQIFTEGEARALAGYLFSYQGHIFKGWNTMKNGSGTSYDDRQTITVNSDMTLYAQWKKLITFVTVTFDANGGTGEMLPQQYIVGSPQVLRPNTFSKPDCHFVCWNTAADGSGTTYTDTQEITISNNLTLYALWANNVEPPDPQPGTGIRVTFVANGGNGYMPPQTYTAGVAHTLDANTFTWDNHVFLCWTTDSYGNGTAYADMEEITLEESIVVYAQWMAITGSVGTHAYVDLGFSDGTLWAVNNVGATSPVDFGDYFAWGETEPKETYSWGNYKYSAPGASNGDPRLIKYCPSDYFGYNGFSDSLRVLFPEDDAVTANWGSNWRMPAEQEFRELLTCPHIWICTVGNAVNGIIFVGPNGNRIFFPGAGFRYDENAVDQDIYFIFGSYPSNSLYSGGDCRMMNELLFYHYNIVTNPVIDIVCKINGHQRAVGTPVRAVFAQ